MSTGGCIRGRKGATPRFIERAGYAASRETRGVLTIVSSKVKPASSARRTGQVSATRSRRRCWSGVRSSGRCTSIANRRGDAVGVVVDVDCCLADVPASVLGVHRDHRRDTRGERRGQQLVRRRSLVGAAEALGLVGDDRVASVDIDLVPERCCLCGGLWRSCSSECHHPAAQPCPAVAGQCIVEQLDPTTTTCSGVVVISFPEPRPGVLWSPHPTQLPDPIRSRTHTTTVAYNDKL